jgi:hypothetical protein
MKRAGRMAQSEGLEFKPQYHKKKKKKEWSVFHRKNLQCENSQFLHL